MHRILKDTSVKFEISAELKLVPISNKHNPANPKNIKKHQGKDQGDQFH